MKRKLLRVLLGTSMLMMTFTGCGTESSTPANAATPQEMTTVKLQLKWLPQAQFMGYYVGQEKGYYEEEGIKLEILPGGPDIGPANQVSAGAADLAVMDAYTLLSYQDQGYPLVEVAQIFQKSSFILTSFKDKGINGATDLKGKTIGAWLGGADSLIYATLAKYDIDKDKNVTIAKQDYTMDAFIRGEFDAASAHTYNEYHVLLEAGYKPEDFNIIDVNEEGTAMLEDCLIANEEWLAEEGNQEIVTRFLRATIKGWADACNDPATAAQSVWNAVDQSSTTLEHQTSMAEEVAKITVPEGFDAAKIGYIDPELVTQTANIALEYGIISNIPEKIYDTTAWENAIK